MTPDQIRIAFIAALKTVAPEIDAEHIRPDVGLRDQLDIDSMDFLNFIIALHKALKIEIPETDYPQLASLERGIEYIAMRIKGIVT